MHAHHFAMATPTSAFTDVTGTPDDDMEVGDKLLTFTALHDTKLAWAKFVESMERDTAWRALDWTRTVSVRPVCGKSSEQRRAKRTGAQVVAIVALSSDQMTEYEGQSFAIGKLENSPFSALVDCLSSFVWYRTRMNRAFATPFTFEHDDRVATKSPDGKVTGLLCLEIIDDSFRFHPELINVWDNVNCKVVWRPRSSEH